MSSVTADLRILAARTIQKGIDDNNKMRQFVVDLRERAREITQSEAAASARTPADLPCSACRTSKVFARECPSHGHF